MAKIYILCSEQYLKTYRTLNKYLEQNEFKGQKNGLIWTSAINVSLVIKETYTEQQQQEENKEKIQLFEAQGNLV